MSTDFVTTPTIGRGKGRARPSNLHPAVRENMDMQAARSAARRERLREQAKTGDPPQGRSQFHERLRAARTYRDKTQKDVADQLGVTRGTVALWEQVDPGYRTTPKPHQVVEIARYLSVPVEFFLHDEFAATEAWKAIEMYGRRAEEPQAVAAPAVDVLLREMRDMRTQLQAVQRATGTVPLDEDVEALARDIQALPGPQRQQAMGVLRAVLSSLPK